LERNWLECWTADAYGKNLLGDKVSDLRRMGQIKIDGDGNSDICAFKSISKFSD
jgi:hypothetical protein